MIPSGIWKHYKGGYYQVLGVGAHSETKQLMVVYVSLNGIDLPGPRMRIRPLNGPEGFLTPARIWESPARIHKCEVPRFEFVGNEIIAEGA